MRVTQTLMNEHRVIEVMLNCLEAMAERCAATKELDSKAAADAVWFLRIFADRFHHGKEETGLFPIMESRGFAPGAGPTAVMRAEHDTGRELLDRIEASTEGAAAGDKDAAHDFVLHSLSFVDHLRGHIQKEDHCLFPMADQLLSSEDHQQLEQRFNSADAGQIDQEALDRCHRLVDTMADRFGVAATAAAGPE